MPSRGAAPRPARESGAWHHVCLWAVVGAQLNARSTAHMNAYDVLAATVDVVHALAMLAWGTGLPLLFWHHFPRLSRGYMWFAIAFVSVSVASHLVLGECALTRIARELWKAGGSARDDTPFLSLLVNAIAGIRPSNRQAVWIWEAAIFLTSVGGLRCWRRTGPRPLSDG